MTRNRELLARWTIKPAWRSRVASRNSLSSATRAESATSRKAALSGHGASNGSSRASQRGNGASRLAMYRISAGKLSTNRPSTADGYQIKCPIPSDGKASPSFQCTRQAFFAEHSLRKICCPTQSSSASLSVIVGALRSCTPVDSASACAGSISSEHPDRVKMISHPITSDS